MGIHPWIIRTHVKVSFSIGIQNPSLFLQVFIAQREFEEAVDLIDRASAFCNDHSDSGIVIFQLDRPLIERTNLLHLKQLQKCNDAVKKVSQDTSSDTILEG